MFDPPRSAADSTSLWTYKERIHLRQKEKLLAPCRATSKFIPAAMPRLWISRQETENITTQTANGSVSTYALERIKWYLWHGNVFQALNELQSLEMDWDAAAFESKNENSQKLLKGVEELHTYVGRNQEFVPNYGERYRNGESIASGFVESAINQVVSKRMVKKQQMGWS